LTFFIPSRPRLLRIWFQHSHDAPIARMTYSTRLL
jgi:hypothetical protein